MERSLEKLEQLIKQADTDVLETGYYLRDIRDRKLWAKKASSFEKYCYAEFDFSVGVIWHRLRAVVILDILKEDATLQRFPTTVDQANLLARGLRWRNHCQRERPEVREAILQEWKAIVAAGITSADQMLDYIRKVRGLDCKTHREIRMKRYLREQATPQDVLEQLRDLYGTGWVQRMVAEELRQQALERLAA
jgi:hypothetical protein